MFFYLIWRTCFWHNLPFPALPPSRSAGPAAEARAARTAATAGRNEMFDFTTHRGGAAAAALSGTDKTSDGNEQTESISAYRAERCPPPLPPKNNTERWTPTDEWWSGDMQKMANGMLQRSNLRIATTIWRPSHHHRHHRRNHPWPGTWAEAL